MPHYIFSVKNELKHVPPTKKYENQVMAYRQTIITNDGILENEVADEPKLGKSGTIQRYWWVDYDKS
jgi:predicted acetyltransferase